MYSIIQDTYYVGVNERIYKKFESIWPIPEGISYNSYLIIDDKVALIDACEQNLRGPYLQHIHNILGEKPIDYLIVNHMEPDHSGALTDICMNYPKVEIIGNYKTLEMIKGFYGLKCRTHVINDGEMLSLGKHQLRFYLTPMVHWPETMMTYDELTQALFSGDAFGCFGALNGAIIDKDMCLDIYWSEMRRYYASIIGKYGAPVQAAIKKLTGLPISLICSTHGPVWKEEILRVVNYYDLYSQYKADSGVVIAYGSMYGNTAAIAEEIACKLAETGIKNIKLFNVEVTDISYILSAIFEYNSLILGSAAYNGELMPNIQTLMWAIHSRGIKNRYYGCFGTYAWGEAPLNKLTDFGNEMGWETIYPKISQKYKLQTESIPDFQRMAKMFAEKMLGS